jgi:O-antigen/teichoic acid export membrane protein
MITLSVVAAWAIVLLISFIISLLVLIRQFIHGGALHGIIGLITGGIWTFFWGWIKNRKFKLTGTMILWTLLLILLISPIVLINYIDLPILKDAEKMITAVIKDPSIDTLMESFNKKPAKKTANKKS